MISLTETTRRLRIGKRRLYQMLEQEGITPTLKSGHKLLDQDQFNRLASALQNGQEAFQGMDQSGSGTGSTQGHHGAGMASGTKQADSNPIYEPTPALMQRMSSEIDHLRELLANEQAERRAERQERENYQQMVMVLQGDMKQLRQQLLEAPSTSSFSVVKPEAEPDTPAEFTESTTRPETVASTGRGSSSFLGVGLSVAAIVGVLFYAAITQGGEWLSSSLQQQISAALKVNGTEPDTR